MTLYKNFHTAPIYFFMVTLYNTFHTPVGVEAFPSIPIAEEALEVVSQPILIIPPRKKWMTFRVLFSEQIFKETHDIEASRSGSVTILPRYIPS